MRDVIIGTAGHIDHGKTTLVKALTGIDTDRLEEEKRRGITIDIGFAHLALGDYRVGFIDVPGHEKFVKNMLAGIGGIDLALLVVAANESVMPQTVEHFEICSLLGIRKGLVAITKKDLVDEELLSLVEEEVRELVRGTFLEDGPIVGVDSVSGSGLDALREAIVAVLQTGLPHKDHEGHVFRMPIDRVFTIRGFGTVVTGTPARGALSKDETVAVHPSGKTGKVRGIEIFNQPAERALAGQRTALNITGLDKQDLERGMVLSRPGVFVPSHMFDAAVIMLPRAARPLKHGSPIRFHQGSAELVGRVYLIEAEEIAPGSAGLAQLRLDTATICCPRDHFILRSYSPATTIAGGIILHNSPGKHTRKESAAVVPWLRKLQARWEEADKARNEDELRSAWDGFERDLLDYLVLESGLRGLDLSELTARTGRERDWLLSAARKLPSLVILAQDPPLAVNLEVLAFARNRVVAHVEGSHARNPLSPGVPREELKARVMPGARAAVAQHVIDQLVAERKLRLNGGNVLPFGVDTDLTESQEQIRSSIIEKLDRSPYQPPSLEELCAVLEYPPAEVRRIFHFLLGRGELVRVTSDIVMSAGQVQNLKNRLKGSFGSGQAFGVAEFKEIFNVSRKYAIPILEYLDREKVTRRAADKRIVL